MGIPIAEAIVAGIAVAWTVATEAAANLELEVPKSSFFLLYTGTSCMALLLLLPDVRRAGMPPHSRVPPLAAVVGFLSLWTGCNYAYIVALARIPPSMVTALFSTAPAFVYLFSTAILGLPHDAVRACAVAIAVGGVVLTSLGAVGEGPFGTGSSKSSTAFSTALGCVLAVIAAIAAALYKVLFRFCFGQPSPFAVAHFLGVLGCACAVVLWTALLALVLTGTEDTPPLSNSVAWTWVMVHALAALAFNFLVNWGVVRTYPLFISIGTILGIPLSVLWDCAASSFRGEACLTVTSPAPLLGFLAIIVSFILLVVRDHQVRSTGQEACNDEDDHGDEAGLVRRDMQGNGQSIVTPGDGGPFAVGGPRSAFASMLKDDGETSLWDGVSADGNGGRRDENEVASYFPRVDQSSVQPNDPRRR